jgi:hypothetical protein
VNAQPACGEFKLRIHPLPRGGTDCIQVDGFLTSLVALHSPLMKATMSFS